MTITPQSIITEARDTLNDSTALLYRASNDELVRYVNDGLAEISVLRPDLFLVLGDLDCIANQCDQVINFSDAQALFDVLSIHGGAVVPYCDMASLDAFLPGWRSVAAGAAVNWTRRPKDSPLRFFIYPAAPADQTLDVLYVKNPTTVTLNDSITDVPLTMKPALANYVIYRTESKDDESASSGRAASSYEAFKALVMGAK